MTKVYFIFLLCALSSYGSSGYQTGFYGGAKEQSSYIGQSGANQGSGYYGTQSHLNPADSYKTDSASSGYSGTGSPSGYSGSGVTSGYSGSSTYTRSGSSSGQDGSVDYSGSGSKTGYSISSSNGAYSQQQGHTSNLKDHNGLSENEVNQLAAEGNRRRMLIPYYMTPNRGLMMIPNRYSSLTPSKYYARPPVYGRSGDEAHSNSASNYGSSGSNVRSSDATQQIHKYSSTNNAGSGYGLNDNNAYRVGHQEYSGDSHEAAQSGASEVKSDSSESNQNAGHEKIENSRRFYLGNNPYNPDPFGAFADFNRNNYLNAALHQYGK